MRQRVLHALDLGMLGDWDGAKRSLENLDDPIVPRLITLLTEQQRRERERGETQAVARHELGNAISIAQANMEALIDGVLQATPERLAGIRDALVTCGMLLEDLKKQSRTHRDSHVRIAEFDVRELISSQLQLVSGIAESKDVKLQYDANGRDEVCSRYRGDPDRVALFVRDMLLGAVRYTPPGGTIDIRCVRPNGEMELAVSQSADSKADGGVGFSVASKLLESLGEHASVVTEHPGSTTFALRLPAIPLAP